MTNYNVSKLAIMVVDDHRPIRSILRGVLREFGVESITEASDGQDALNKLANFQADIIFTDYKMEPMNGLELVHKIRAGEATVDRYVPIVVISAYTEVEKVISARDLGATEFLGKPFNSELIYSRLKSLIESPRDFVENESFFGPDRRRRSEEILIDERRDED